MDKYAKKLILKNPDEIEIKCVVFGVILSLFVIPSEPHGDEGSSSVIPNLIGNPDNRRLDSRSRAGMTN